MILERSIWYIGQKLADAYPAGTLDSCSGTQNEYKNTQNNVIEVKIRILYM